MFEILLALTTTSPLISQSLLDLTVIILFFYLLISTRSTSTSVHTSQKIYQRIRILIEDFIPSKTHKIFLFLTTMLAVSGLIGLLLTTHHPKSASEILKTIGKFQWIVQTMVFGWAIQHAIHLAKTMAFKIDLFLATFCTLCLIPVIYGFNIYFFDGFDWLADRKTGYRIVGLINSATYHGIIVGALLMASSIFCLFNWKDFSTKKRVLLGLFLSILLISALLTLTRGVWLSLVISWITLILLLGLKRLVLGSLIGILLTASIVFFFAEEKMTRAVTARLASDTCRAHLMLSHIRMFQQNPIFGIGFRQNLESIREFWPDTAESAHCHEHRKDGNQAHNQYLNTLGTMGLIGFVLFFGLHVFLLRLNWSILRNQMGVPDTNGNFTTALSLRWVAVAAFVIQVFYLSTYLTESSFDYGKVRIPLLIAWAAVLAMDSIRTLIPVYKALK